MLSHRELCIRVCVIVSGTLGLAMVVIGAVIYAQVFPKIVRTKIDENLALRNWSESLEMFEHSDNPVYMKFYFFNVENKDEVNENGAKPKLKEMGPYVYRKELQRNVEGWDDDLGTILYKENATYYFEPDMTTGTLQDVINHVNMVSIGMINSKKLDLLELLTGTNKSEMIKNAPGKLVESHTVAELLFDGVDFKEYLPPFNTSRLKISTACEFADNCKYAFFLNKNGTESESFEVKTGVPAKNFSESNEEAMDHYREIVAYDGKKTLSYWSGESCNALNGTDGTQFPPGVDREEGLYVFSTDVCRSLYLEYVKDEDVEGIGGLRYVIPSSGYAAPAVNPDNWCFFSENGTDKFRSRGGVLPVSACYGGYPVMASAPHFYMASEEYRADYEGLHPEQSLHETFLDVEPMTGATISAAKRLQISMRVDPNPAPNFLKFINETTAFPIFWAEETGMIDKKNSKLMKDELLTPYKAGKWSFIGLMILGSLILIITFIVFIKVFMNRRNQKTCNMQQDLTKVGQSANSELGNISVHLPANKFQPTSHL